MAPQQHPKKGIFGRDLPSCRLNFKCRLYSKALKSAQSLLKVA
jgi:hypothetical protein